jgi:hypothetical protein
MSTTFCTSSYLRRNEKIREEMEKKLIEVEEPQMD